MSSILLSLGNFSFAANEWEVYSSVKSQALSEPVSVYEYTEAWQQKLEDGKLATHRSSAELGVRKNGFSIASIYERYDIIRPNRDTTEIFHSVKNDKDFEVGRRYAIDIDGYQLAMNGLKLAWKGSISEQVQAGVALKILRGLSFLDGKAKGNATAVSNKDYDFDLDLNYHYTKDPILDRPYQAPSSDDTQGYALDLFLRYDFRLNHFVSINLENAYGEMKWEDAGETVADATSDNKIYDSNGFVEFRPLLQGVERSRDYRQKIPMVIDAKYRRPINSSWSMQLGAHGTESRLFRELALLHHSDLGEWQLSFLPKERAIGLGWRHSYFAIMLATDDVEIKNANYFALNLSGFVPL